MQVLNNNELLEIVGGFSITGTIINAFTGAARFIYSTGQAFGSGMRRISGNNLCPLK